MAVAFALGLAVGGCSREPTATGTTTVTSAGYVPPSQAKRELTLARCNRASECGEIGPGRAFRTMDACLLEAESLLRHTLGSDNCAQGVSELDLDSCITATRARHCDVAIQQTRSCRLDKLCPPPR